LQVKQFAPSLVATADEDGAAALRSALPGFKGSVLSGSEGLERVAISADADLVVSGLVGALGLRPTLAAIESGKDVALANKEVLVVAGELVREAAQAAGVQVFPLDSEHNAIYQAMHGHRREDVGRIILTASGGPFLGYSKERLQSVTREQALRHPTWKMGSKITIDSSTLMNKGLEVIEAHWLFGLSPDRIAVVIHPQSIVHSMVEYVDGSVIAQLGIPDMSIPISYILAYPERLRLDYLPRLDLVTAGPLEFAEPDLDAFPCLALAYRALRAKGTAPAVLNAANEIVVEAFLQDQVSYLEIPRIVEAVLDRHTVLESPTLNELLAADVWAREEARVATKSGLSRAAG
jgi:1-deoxy-D-xylulose-5-phosphate reductoisomerase